MLKRCLLGWSVVASVACGSAGGESTGAADSTLSAGPLTTSSSTGDGNATTSTSTPTTGDTPTTNPGGTGNTTDAPTGTSSAPATSSTDAGSTSTGSSGPGSTGGGETDTGTTGAVDFCQGEGGILLPGDELTCTGDLGKKTFLFAICSCSGLTANNALTTDSFDSEMMEMMQMTPMDGGSVGVNGAYTASSNVDIGGSLWVDGKIQTFNSHDVAQILQCSDDVTASSPSHVAADMFLEGNLNAQNKTVTIDGDLYIPAGKQNNGATVLGKTIKGPVDVKTPCDCDDPIDVAAIVQGFMADNDNAALPIAADELVGLPAPKEIELPCGRYFLDAIDSNSSLKISLTGRTVIAIAGDVQNAGAFTIELGPDAELDLFIAGNANLNNVAAVGDPKRPAATRIYVGGAFKFASDFTLGANLYQPNATFTANNMAEIWGSLFVGGLQLASPLVVHYDQAILELEGCEDPNKGCGDCHDCANPTPACTEEGTCGPCVVDSDCCPPLACDGGICKAIIPG